MDASTDLVREATISNAAPPPHATNTSIVPTAEQRDEDGRTSTVLAACKSQTLNGPAALVSQARQPGGFLTDEARQAAWPFLLGVPDDTIEAWREGNMSNSGQHDDWRSLPRHRDEDQVRLDVDRSFVYYPNEQSAASIESLKGELLEVITATLRQNPKLCYFQGFHDIVQVMLLVLGKVRALDVVPRLSLLRLRDFMLPSLSQSLTHLDLIPAILAAADPELAHHVDGTKPFFALAATLTLFAHDVESYSEIARLFDFLLAEEAAAVMYVFTATIILRRGEILEISADEQDILHWTLSKLPKPLNLEIIIQKSISLIEAHPPGQLPNHPWAKIPKASVLKTTHPAGQQYTLAEGTAFFEDQLTQLVWLERRKKVSALLWAYRRPIAGAAAAVLVAMLSYGLQRYQDNPLEIFACE